MVAGNASVGARRSELILHGFHRRNPIAKTSKQLASLQPAKKYGYRVIVMARSNGSSSLARSDCEERSDYVQPTGDGDADSNER